MTISETTSSSPKSGNETVSPKWDLRFLELAYLVSTWSKDPSTRCGAVIVRPDRTVCSVGYNGFPRNLPDDPVQLQSRDAKYSQIIHAEVNALVHAREPVTGYALYTWPFLSCDRCTVQMLQAGISRFVAPFKYADDSLRRWHDSLCLSRKYIETAGATFREYPVCELPFFTR